jgi:hypothetical protein
VGKNPTQESQKTRGNVLVREVKVDEATLSRMHYERLYRSILGRSPTEIEVESMKRMQTIMNLGDKDPLWAILVTLENYNTMYGAQNEQMMRISQTVAELAGQAEKSARMAQNDIALLPRQYAKKAPDWLNLLFSFKGLNSVLVVSAFLMSTYAMLRPSSPERIALLNGGYDSLATCFYGRGRVETYADGRVICHPADGAQVFGFVIGKTDKTQPKR